ncbi:DUF5316 family protein [Sutcliffiella rhizosphaerae]|uniref:Uncharacterized protein n=1 Tax=Sutcliffiella rhizosphaerae TaxID=2880967 RepID=A0ABM8YNI0_9BACI|nr:DUF5316 family protein [Sutcliffiella rhizosphaerae]CAG9621298.1 hypothetical protein BACCIP111883_02070 [Sutcliffiella rhizosphaerae]
MLNIVLIIGGMFIVISGIFFGVWTSGQQHRANVNSETTVHKDFRTKVGMYSGLLGLICFGLAAIIYYF